ncbi:gem-associated protein 5 [Periophthalmus magnuspinnatus]|uniref:gem-associated protein 5 n=1 Tax=Periophthalmus magnuspinnatus TaxID=409849 RepID=UPI00145BEE7B|nr:gem-associated protein 5 [Periophthalmus magnuspinnatus]
MHERCLPAAPNWYCSRCSDVSEAGLFGFGAKNTIYLVQVSASSCRVTGELLGHKDLVSSFSFCHHSGQTHICVSSSCDGTVRFWDTETKCLLKETSVHQKPVSAVHWSPADKNLVLSGDEKGVVVCHWFNTGDINTYFPEPRTIFCLSCSPHNWSHVAVGYKDGMIVLIDISKKGEVLHRLRGHDDEIHSLSWNPEPGEGALYGRTEDTDAGGSVWGEGCLLASGSRDQTLRIWSTDRGKSVMMLKLPYLKKRGSVMDPGVKERLWVNVHWPKGRRTHVISSCFSGELLLWDLLKTGKQKWSLFGSSSDGQNHNRIVFNMSSVQTQEQQLLLSTSMDREIKCWDMSTLELCWTLPSLGGFVYSLCFSPLGSGSLALGVGDNLIRVWNTQSSKLYDTRCFWQGIKSKVTALAWHPQKEGALAFGTDDGKVGIYGVFSNKPPEISSSYHKKTVYTLAWGPPVPPLSFGSSKGKSAFSLYSCAGEGTVLQHDPHQLSGEAFNIDKLIKDTNNIQHKLPLHTDLSWKPDGKVLAIGNEDGCIDVYEAPSLRLLCSIQQHHKIINCLRWHHGLHSPELSGLLASGSSNAIVYIHNLKQVLDSPGDSPVVISEPFRRLCGHTAKITGMSWSHHHDDRLVTVSYDGTAQVWDVLQEAPVCNYRGHHGNLLCVNWSPLDPDVVWTGGKDFTVHEWRVSKQEFDKPPKGKKMVELKEKKKKSKAKKSSAGGAVVNGESPTFAVALSEEEEDETSSTNGSLPPIALSESWRKPPSAVKNKEKPELSMKKKKPRSILPLSTSMDHRPKDELLQDCTTLASVTHSAAPAGCIPGQGDHVHLGLFSDREALHRMFEAEEEAHLEAGHFESAVYLRLWSGDLQGALQLATEKGELSDHLLSLAPMAGFCVWSAAVDSYVKQLCLQEQFVKAASHLLSINKLHEAVDLLRSHRLYREAIALVKARLPQDDPVLKELYQSWAAVLEKDGHFSTAAKCYLAAGSSFDAVKVISRKNEVSSIRAAADVAQICGEATLFRSLSLRCAKELSQAQDWSSVQDVLQNQDALLVYRLHFSLAEFLFQFLSESGAFPASSAVGSGLWVSADSDLSFIKRVERVWDEQFRVSRTSEGPCDVKSLLQELKSVESPQPTANVPLKQVMLLSSLHLTRAFLCFLCEEEEQTMKELWWAVSSVKDTGHFLVFLQLCHLLFPDGDIAVFSSQKSSDTQSAAALSLQSFVRYLQMYELWWSSSLANGDGIVQSGAAGTKEEQEKEFSRRDLGFEVLLCESTAAAQSVQRAVGEIQDKLSALVTKHQTQGQEGEEERQNGVTMATHRQETTANGEEPETFLSLSMKMSQYQKQLSDLPDSVKGFPRPDVLECSLVLLLLGRSSSVVSETLKCKSTDLLRRFGMSSCYFKAAQKLTST